MKNLKTKKAFTIIEVMLVVSISGLMLVTMLVGWNANIERQRYNDSVNTFKSDIREFLAMSKTKQTTKTNESIVIQTVLILALVVIMAVHQLVQVIVLF